MIILMVNRAALALCFALSGSVAAQMQDGLKFEVASIKPAPPGAQMGGSRIPPGKMRYVITAAPLKNLIILAYGVKYWQIEGGPSWVEKDYFDVDAKAERPSTNDEFHVMLRNLLEDRFHLKVHREVREEPVYEIHIEKGGVIMKEHSPPDLNGPPMVKPTSREGKLGIEGTNVSVDDLAVYFSAILGRMVINKTGLPGRYDLVLLNSASNALAPTVPAVPTLEEQILFEDIPAQLGLRIVPAKGPVERVVIDHAEKLSEN